jgi:O6-methylguanine-DNA--protein-cysteine methyltransferase
MNLIQQQAEDFYKSNFDERGEDEEFIGNLRIQLNEYRKQIHKLEFTERIMTMLKINYDKHLITCKFPNDRLKCYLNKNYENSLFFIQNEREDLLENLPESEFTNVEKFEINESIVKIIEDLQTIQLGQQITYDDILAELNELKEFYYLNKNIGLSY